MSVTNWPREEGQASRRVHCGDADGLKESFPRSLTEPSGLGAGWFNGEGPLASAGGPFPYLSVKCGAAMGRRTPPPDHRAELEDCARPLAAHWIIVPIHASFLRQLLGKNCIPSVS